MSCHALADLCSGAGHGEGVPQLLLHLLDRLVRQHRPGDSVQFNF